MPYLYKQRERPKSWDDFSPTPLHPYLLPFSYTNWAGEWMAYILGKWSIFEVLDYVGSFSILIAVIFYFADSGDRLKQKHYQAWQVINTAQGKGGSGGRVDALQELNDDGVSLVGVDVSGAYLRGVLLIHADLRRGDFDGADLRNAALRQSNLELASLLGVNLRESDCTSANLASTNLTDADLSDAILRDADVHDSVFNRVDLSNADLDGIRNWQARTSMKLANIHGVRNAPDGFVDWAKSQGAVDIADNRDYYSLLARMPGQSTSAPTRSN